MIGVALFVLVILTLTVLVWRTGRRSPTSEGFGWYSPACGARRAECHGLTKGVMPDIERGAYLAHGCCCGFPKVPPPVVGQSA